MTRDFFAARFAYCACIALILLLEAPLASAGEFTLFDKTITVACPSYQYLPINNSQTPFEVGDSLAISVNVPSGGKVDLLIMDAANFDSYEKSKNCVYYNCSVLNTSSCTAKFVIPSRATFYIIVENAEKIPNGAKGTKDENVTMKVVWSGKNATPVGVTPTIPGLNTPTIPGVSDSPYGWCIVNIILMLIVSVIISIVIWGIKKLYTWSKGSKGQQATQPGMQIVTGRMLEEEKAKRAMLDDFDSRIRTMEVQLATFTERIATLESRLGESLRAPHQKAVQSTAPAPEPIPPVPSVAQVPVSRVKCPVCGEIIPIFTAERPVKIKCSKCGKEGMLGKKS